MSYIADNFNNEGFKTITWEKRLSELKACMDLQNSEGNWDTDDYMHGLTNGLILAHHIMSDCKEEIQYMWKDNEEVETNDTGYVPQDYNI